MIDCPICHVKNENDSRFCQECGNRLNVAPRDQGQASAAGNTPAQPITRLKSPLLEGGSYDDEPSHKSAGEMDRLKRMSSDKTKSKDINYSMPKGNPFDPRKSGAMDPNQMSDSDSKGTHKKGLHSPLLSGDDYEEEDFFAEEEKYSYRVPRSSGSHPPISAPRHGLRSPILGGAGQDYDSFVEEEDEELFDDDDNPNPNILRSPLLAAKMPIIEHPPEPSRESHVKPVAPAPINQPPTNLKDVIKSDLSSSSTKNPEPPVINQSLAYGQQAQPKSVPPMPGYQANPPAEPIAPPAKPSYNSYASTPKELYPIDEMDTVNIRRAGQASPNLGKFAQEKPSSNLKFVGICAIVVLLIKLYCLSGYAASDWFKFTPFVIDQFAQIGIIICVILACMLPRN